MESKQKNVRNLEHLLYINTVLYIVLTVDLYYCFQDPQPDTGQGSDSGGEGGEDCIQDKEAEKEKCLQKRQ